MTTKHTTGPWTVSFTHKIHNHGVKCAYADFSILESKHAPANTCTANAHLIAAAPELLEACKKALAVVDTIQGADRLGIVLANAIAKAEGK